MSYKIPQVNFTTTDHNVLIGGPGNTISNVGPGTAGQVFQSGGPSADPSYSTATYPSTTTINQILYSSANNTVGAIPSANSALLLTNSSGVPSFSSSLTNGQILIGSTGASPTPGTLTAGNTIEITNGAASISVAVLLDYTKPFLFGGM